MHTLAYLIVVPDLVLYLIAMHAQADPAPKKKGKSKEDAPVAELILSVTDAPDPGNYQGIVTVKGEEEEEEVYIYHTHT